MRPSSISTFSVPVEISSRPYHQRHQMALFRTFVVGTRRINKVVCHGGGRDIRTGKRGIHRSRSTTWLGKCVCPVVRSIVVTVIIPLFLSRIIPPGGFKTRSTFAHT